MKAPEETIRAYVEQHGPVKLTYESLEMTWAEGRLEAVRRRQIAADLERAGISVDPPLENAADEDLITVSLAPARRSSGWFLAVPLAGMVIGVLGPWAKDVFATEQGIDAEGWLVLVVGAAGTLALWLHARRGHPAALPAGAALAGATAAAVVTSAFRDAVDDPLVAPAWGLYVSFAGAALLVALSMTALTRN